MLVTVELAINLAYLTLQTQAHGGGRGLEAQDNDGVDAATIYQLIKVHWFVLCRRTQCPKTRRQGPKQGQYA